MKPIHLDPQQRQELERRRHETHDKRIYERLSAVLWVAAGKDRFDVADFLARIMHTLGQQKCENKHKDGGTQDFRALAVAAQAKQTVSQRTAADTGAASESPDASLRE
jgi:hypothetical protein